MNRSNVGNVVTNGMQILSVGATTASRVLKGKADSALNNLSKEEQRAYHEMGANKMRDEMKSYNERQSLPETDEISVDSIMESAGFEMSANSPQSTNIQQKVNNDISFSREWIRGLSEPNPVDELIRNVKKGVE